MQQDTEDPAGGTNPPEESGAGGSGDGAAPTEDAPAAAPVSEDTPTPITTVRNHPGPLLPGRIVHYRQTANDRKEFAVGAEGAIQPAMITRVWSPDVVNLRILLDAAWDCPPRMSVPYNPDPSVPGTWGWPQV